MNKIYRKPVFLGLFGLGLLIGVAPRAESAVTNVVLSNYSIPYETMGTTGTTIVVTLDALSSIEIDIFRLENISDAPSAENQVAAIVRNNLAGGTYNIFWDALWLLGNDVGRQDGNFQVIVNATDVNGQSNFVVGQLLQITSVDIHNFQVIPSTDANQNPALPYRIAYRLAKDSFVTLRVENSSGTVVRTLLSNSPQFGEQVKTNVVNWDGLGDNNRPVELGIYNVIIDAKDPVSADMAIRRTRSATIYSLATLGETLDRLFADNAIIFPNPVRNSRATFQFLAVRNNATLSLKIYTLTGDLVRDETFVNQSTGNTIQFPWDTTNQAGNEVGRGLYYYVVRQEDPEGTLQTIKKFAVIR